LKFFKEFFRLENHENSREKLSFSFFEDLWFEDNSGCIEGSKGIEEKCSFEIYEMVNILILSSKIQITSFSDLTVIY